MDYRKTPNVCTIRAGTKIFVTTFGWFVVSCFRKRWTQKIQVIDKDETLQRTAGCKVFRHRKRGCLTQKRVFNSSLRCCLLDTGYNWVYFVGKYDASNERGRGPKEKLGKSTWERINWTMRNTGVSLIDLIRNQCVKCDKWIYAWLLNTYNKNDVRMWSLQLFSLCEHCRSVNSQVQEHYGTLHTILHYIIVTQEILSTMVYFSVNNSFFNRRSISTFVVKVVATRAVTEFAFSAFLCLKENLSRIILIDYVSFIVMLWVLRKY